MRRFIARVLRIPDTRREDRLLETAMRTAPRPAPPAGLRERLVADALAAAEEAAPRRRSHLWVAWAAPAAALLVVVAWLAFGGHVDKRVTPTRTSTPQVAAGPSGPAHPQTKPPAPSRETQALPQEKRPVHRPAPHLAPAPKHRPKPPPGTERAPAEKQPEIETNKEPAPEQPVVIVKVGPRREGEVSYARAAARDENGVRTEWAIYHGRKAGEYREEMCVSDSDGRGFCLTTTSVNDQLDRLEETL